MDKSIFFIASGIIVAIAAALCIAGHSVAVASIGAFMVAAGAFIGFSAVKPNERVKIGGQSAAVFAASSKKISWIAVLTVSGALVSGLATTLPEILGRLD